MTSHRFLSRDSKDLSCIPDHSVQLVVTSPPYPMIEMWDEIFAAQDQRIAFDLQEGNGTAAFEKMHLILDAIWRECDRVLIDNGFVCINIGDATRTINDCFQLYSNHTRIINAFLAMGYCVLPDIHWRKQSNAPNKFMGSGMFPAGAYVTYEHEYILVFRKGSKRVFNGHAKELRQKSAFFWEERNVWFSDLWEIKGTAQKVDKGNSRARSAAYPLEVPYRLINMYSAEGDTVLDPFGGTGTTALACAAAQRNSICVDIDSEFSKMAGEQIIQAKEMLNRIIQNRLSAHAAFIESQPAEKRAKCYKNPNHDFDVKTRQEIAIQLDAIDRITATDDGVECTYSPKCPYTYQPSLIVD